MKYINFDEVPENLVLNFANAILINEIANELNIVPKANNLKKYLSMSRINDEHIAVTSSLSLGNNNINVFVFDDFNVNSLYPLSQDYTDIWRKNLSGIYPEYAIDLQEYLDSKNEREF